MNNNCVKKRERERERREKRKGSAQMSSSESESEKRGREEASATQIIALEKNKIHTQREKQACREQANEQVATKCIFFRAESICSTCLTSRGITCSRERTCSQ